MQFGLLELCNPIGFRVTFQALDALQTRDAKARVHAPVIALDTPFERRVDVVVTAIPEAHVAHEDFHQSFYNGLVVTFGVIESHWIPGVQQPPS
jgi:hypothetical protein